MDEPGSGKVSTVRAAGERGQGVRLAGALVLSLLVHAAFALPALFLDLARRLLPKPPIEFTLLPPKKKPPPPPVLPPEVAQAPQPEEPKPIAPRPPKPIPKPGQKPGPPTLRPLTGLGPTAIEQDLGVRVLVRMATIRQSPHRGAVVRLLGAFPDARLLAAGTSVASGDALGELLVDRAAVLLIATTDPTGYERTATALYALHDADLDLLSLLRPRRVAPWDTRTLQEPLPGLLAFARSDLLGPGTARPRVLTPQGGPPGAPPVAAPDEPPAPVVDPAWPRRLRALLQQPGAALSLEVFNLNQRLVLRRVPTPTRIAAALSAAPDPELRIRAELRTPAEAEVMRTELERLRGEMLQDLRYALLGLSELLRDVKLTVQGSTIEIVGTAPGRAVDSLLGLAALSLGSLPSGDPAPPPIVTAPAPDLGTPPAPADLATPSTTPAAPPAQ